MAVLCAILMSASPLIAGQPESSSAPEATKAAGRAGVKRYPEELAYARLTDGYWQIWVSDAEGKSSRQITKDCSDKRHPVWSDDGGCLFYRTANYAVYVVDMASGNQKQVLSKQGDIAETAPTRDPKRVMFSRLRQGLPDACDIWTSGIDNSKPIMLTNRPGRQCEMAMSPDGKRIAFVSGEGYGKYDLWTCDPQGDDWRRLTSDAALEATPAWSPDGTRIAFASDAAGDFDVWVMAADGSDRHILEKHPGLDGRPTWSPDGKRIAFHSTRSGSLQIWTMSRDGTSLELLTTGSPCREPAWKPVRKER